MNLTVNWEDYHSRFADDMTEEKFDSLAGQACSRVKRMCRPYVLSTVLVDEGDYRNERIKDAVCTVINAAYAHEVTGTGKGISSVSNDGYSESYVLTKREDAELELNSLVRSCLSGTGLMGAM